MNKNEICFKSTDRTVNTQLEAARAGAVTGAMRRAAESEPHLSAEEIRAEVEAGRALVPANKRHLEAGLDPVAIGRPATTKVNANLGTSSEASGPGAELDKLETALEHGADTVMDLSTGGDLDAIREKIIAKSRAPVGTVPLYALVQDDRPEELGIEAFLTEAEKQAEQGVDFFTIHAGLLEGHLELAAERTGGIVSRGGSLLACWMGAHGKENFLYTNFDRICSLLADYDVAVSLGDGLRPGCLEDATDPAQLAELEVLGELTERAQSAGVQVMVEGPGHVPYDEIERNVRLQQQICDEAPFYVLGPVVSDIFPGYDHLTAAIGATEAARHGAALLCYVTPSEHLGLPEAEDVREGCVAFNIAAHSADIARGLEGVEEPDRKISEARAELDWESQLRHSFDPEKIQAARGGRGEEDKHCSMCGEDWCALNFKGRGK